MCTRPELYIITTKCDLYYSVMQPYEHLFIVAFLVKYMLLQCGVAVQIENCSRSELSLPAHRHITQANMFTYHNLSGWHYSKSPASTHIRFLIATIHRGPACTIRRLHQGLFWIICMTSGRHTSIRLQTHIRRAAQWPFFSLDSFMLCHFKPLCPARLETIISASQLRLTSTHKERCGSRISRANFERRSAFILLTAIYEMCHVKLTQTRQL